MNEFKDLGIYNPSEFEDELYAEWEKSGIFNATNDNNKEKFSIVMPPPNITGQLHMGHAFNLTLQDIIIRWKRMDGFDTLWVPGIDHASIATEAKIVEKLKKEGTTKFEIGREKFLEYALEWKKLYGGTILSQVRKMGCSCDWSHESYTFSEDFQKKVVFVFKNLYDKGLIYRGKRIINWCPKCKTCISDEEVDYNEEAGILCYIKYHVVGENKDIIVATTRPETIFGDTAVAVNPKDKRYSAFIGKKVRIPLANREIPVIADEYVEQEFGTGALKVTPSHDINDFELGLKHNLEQINILNDDATLNEKNGEFSGLSREVARDKIVESLKNQGFVEKVEEYNHNVGSCYRCGTVIEPSISEQWFVKMAKLAEPAIKCVKDDSLHFIPERFVKIYLNWMENVRDWCISRQIWWGHRIPAYFCNECGNVEVDIKKPEMCSKCNSTNLRQDEDTLDTWFSSALWPFATLGWPDKNDLLDKFYPTSVLVTAYDIIFFWVSRMIFSGLEQTHTIPFKDVFIHGLVLDAKGKKMSKSAGNGVNPLDIIDKYGSDALRFSLVFGTANGSDIRYSEDKIIFAKNFANKIWNASKFVIMNIKRDTTTNFDILNLSISDKWILSRLNTTINNTTQFLNKYELGLAAKEVCDFFWNEFCDWYVELCKPNLNKSDIIANNTRSVLKFVLGESLKLLHIFMPFITTKIYNEIFNETELMLTAWPKYNESYSFSLEEKNFNDIISIIKIIREAKVKKNVPFNVKPKAFIISTNNDLCTNIIEQIDSINKLAKADIKITDNIKKNSNDIIIPSLNFEIVIPLNELVDIEEEKKNVIDELNKIQESLDNLNKRLENKEFIEKAPKNIVDKELLKKKEKEEIIKKLSELLKTMEGK